MVMGSGNATIFFFRPYGKRHTTACPPGNRALRTLYRKRVHVCSMSRNSSGVGGSGQIIPSSTHTHRVSFSVLCASFRHENRSFYKMTATTRQFHHAYGGSGLIVSKTRCNKFQFHRLCILHSASIKKNPT